MGAMIQYGPTITTDLPTVRPPAAEPSLVLIQARLVHAVADGTELRGRLAAFADSLGAKPDDLTAATEELAAVGWVATSLGAAGMVTMRRADEGRLRLAPWIPANAAHQRRHHG